MPSNRNNYQRRSGAIGFLVVAIALFVATPGLARSREELRATISVVSVSPARLRVELTTLMPHRIWSFRNVYGPVIGLGERIQNLSGIDSKSETVLVQKGAPGEFITRMLNRISYEVDVATPLRPSDRSHVSWIDESQGLLMLADLLPQVSSGEVVAVIVEPKIPSGWTISANIRSSNGFYTTDDPDAALFLIGDSIHQEKSLVGSHELKVVCAGDWPFSTSDISKWATRMIKEYSQLTGLRLQRDAVISLLPFPGTVGADRWSAETRGNDVVLLLGQHATRQQLLGRIGVILAHEVLHFWVPGSLSLKGDYDWFFEGFTLYQALRTSLKVGLIDFREYLATVARVYDSYLSTVDSDRLSLIELSERRWTTSSSLVYEKGMLAAFIYDLELRRTSAGRLNYGQIYRELFKSDHSTQQANEVILDILDHPYGMNDFSSRYIRNPVRINLAMLLSTYGIRLERQNFRTELSVAKGLSDAQLQLLRSLGYEK